MAVARVHKPSRLSAERVPLLKAAHPGKRAPGGAFASLTFMQRRLAEKWLWKFTRRWGNDLPPWRRGILTAVAKRLALNPPGPGFGRRLHGAHGGKVSGQRAKARAAARELERV